ncbi:SCO6880 family protein [Euzebya sp.]|uniref:SCO6880 family protein n=1 Tax=Euzebya sp. TaxID=1971409 RepID=UPI0035178B84
MSDAATQWTEAVRLSRLPRRGVLLGLSAVQVVTVLFGVVVVVAALYVAGGRGVVWTAPVWVGAAVLTWLPVAGGPLVEWLPIASGWVRRTVTGQRAYRRRVTGPRARGSFTAPGVTGRLRYLTDPDTGAVVVHDRRQQRLIAVAEVTHRSFVLLDPADQQRRVAGWGRVLATACRSGRVARVQVMERTLPGSGAGLTRWWQAHGHDDGSWVARTYQSLIEGAGPTAERHATTISVAVDLQTARPRGAGRGLLGAASVLAREMDAVSSALATADLAPVRWLTAPELAAMIRSAVDPHAAPRLDVPTPTTPGCDLDHAGAMAVTETWDGLRTDSAHHAVVWIAEWPRSPVTPEFLAPLVLSAGVTRTFTLICDPIPTAKATREVRRRKTEHLADAAQRARIGQIEDLRHTAEYDDVLQQEADLTAGHGALRYAGLIAVSAATVDALEHAVAQVEQAAVQASCDTRRLVGQQAAAFAAAALPLCRGI